MVANVAADVGHLFTRAGVRPAHIQSTGPVDHRLVLALHLFLYAVIAFQLTVVVLYWRGRPLARQLVLAGCFFYLFGLRNLKEQWTRSHFAAELSVAAAILAVVLVWYLNTANVREWFYREFYLPEPLPQATAE